MPQLVARTATPGTDTRTARRHSVTRLKLVLLAALFVSACSSTNSAAGTGQSDNLERHLFEVHDATTNLRFEELLTKCAQVNGLQLEGLHHEEPVGEPGASDLDNRQGSGLISGAIAMRDRNVAAAADTTADEHSEEEEQVLNGGPVRLPDGSSYEFGCRAWASSEVDSDPSVVERNLLGQQYAEFVAARLGADAQMVAMEREWSECMSSQGFSGLEKAGDQASLIWQELQKLMAGLVSEDEAIQFDVSITQAAIDCEEPQIARRLEIRDAIAVEFAENFDVVVPAQ